MRTIRFYSREGQSLEVIAKYIFQGDKPLEDDKLKNICACVVVGLDPYDDPYDTMNARLLGLDKDLSDAGYGRVSVATTTDYDSQSDFTYDIVFNIPEKTVSFLRFEVKKTDDPDTPVRKDLVEKVDLGSIVAG